MEIIWFVFISFDYYYVVVIITMIIIIIIHFYFLVNDIFFLGCFIYGQMFYTTNNHYWTNIENDYQILVCKGNKTDRRKLSLFVLQRNDFAYNIIDWMKRIGFDRKKNVNHHWKWMNVLLIKKISIYTYLTSKTLSFYFHKALCLRVAWSFGAQFFSSFHHRTNIRKIDELSKQIHLYNF